MVKARRNPPVSAGEVRRGDERGEKWKPTNAEDLGPPALLVQVKQYECYDLFEKQGGFGLGPALN